jgi:hypothetical protein
MSILFTLFQTERRRCKMDRPVRPGDDESQKGGRNGRLFY